MWDHLLNSHYEAVIKHKILYGEIWCFSLPGLKAIAGFKWLLRCSDYAVIFISLFTVLFEQNNCNNKKEFRRLFHFLKRKIIYNLIQILLKQKKVFVEYWGIIHTLGNRVGIVKIFCTYNTHNEIEFKGIKSND